MSNLLIHEPPLQVLPTLARVIGLSEAIVLQQLHYWITNHKVEGRDMDGRKWIRNTVKQWRYDNFPFWSANTIIRAIDRLREVGILLARSDLNRLGYDKTLWYAIDYDALDTLVKTTPLPKMGKGATQDGYTHLPKMGKGTTQDGYTHLPKMGDPIPETTPETTTETRADFQNLSTSSQSESIIDSPSTPRADSDETLFGDLPADRTSSNRPPTPRRTEDEIKESIRKTADHALVPTPIQAFADYHEDARPVLAVLAEVWKLQAPPRWRQDAPGRAARRGAGGVTADMWESQALELKEICGEYGSAALRMAHATWYAGLRKAGGIAPHTVQSPASIRSDVITVVSAARMQGLTKDELFTQAARIASGEVTGKPGYSKQEYRGAPMAAPVFVNSSEE